MRRRVLDWASGREARVGGGGVRSGPGRVIGLSGTSGRGGNGKQLTPLQRNAAANRQTGIKRRPGRPADRCILEVFRPASDCFTQVVVASFVMHV